MTIEQYLDLGHVVVNVAGNEPPLNYDEQFLRRSNFKRRVEISVPTFSLAPQLVVGTDRVTTITTRLAAKYAEILAAAAAPAADRDATDGRDAAVAQGPRVRPGAPLVPRPL